MKAPHDALDLKNHLLFWALNKISMINWSDSSKISHLGQLHKVRLNRNQVVPVGHCSRG